MKNLLCPLVYTREEKRRQWMEGSGHQKAEKYTYVLIVLSGHSDLYNSLFYTYGGIGNDLMNDFYAHRQGGGHEMHFSRLAVYEDLHHGIKTTKEIQTVHIYEFLKFLLEQGFKSGTIRSYISSFREIYRWDPQLFCNTFEKPSVAGLNQYLEQQKSDIRI